ncbi:MAG: hypothetical protein ACREDI_04590 [Roseiarcus sp.]
MLGADCCAVAVAFKAYFEQICGKTLLEGVSAHMLAGEAPIPGLYGRIAKSFGRNSASPTRASPTGSSATRSMPTIPMSAATCSPSSPKPRTI